MIFSVALRNLFLQWGRFQVLLATLLFGGMVFVIIMGVTSSMTKTLEDKAARYFAGDVIIWGESQNGSHYLEHEGEILSTLKNSGLPIKSYCRRTVVYYANDTTLFFAGASERQRRLIGVDWSLELENFHKMNFVSGGPDGMTSGKGILISQHTAEKLKAHVGDDCLVLLTTDAGQKNTVTLRIEGIFNDSSFFGYASYMDIRTLNRVMGLSDDTLTELGVILQDGISQESAATQIQGLLSHKVPVFPVLTSSAQYDKIVDRSKMGDEKKAVVMTLNVRLAQVKDLLDVLRLIGWVLNGIFLGIVMIGVNNTYRMVVYERTKEIGTMRALGMQKTRLVGIFLAEAGFLGFFGAVLGLIVGALVLYAFTLADWGTQVLTAMFLENGHFVLVLPMTSTILVFVSMVLASGLGALQPGMRAAAMRPVDALRQE